MTPADDRIAETIEVIRSFDMGDQWHSVVDPDMPPELARVTAELIEAYRRADLDWLLEHADPDLVIVQLQELPDFSTYHGRDGYIDALLDWPRQWEHFAIEPRRIFAADDEHLVVEATHRGRSRSVDLEVDAEIVFLLRWRDWQMTNWDMFLSLEEALGRAAERRADGGDDRAAERHGRERA